MSQKIAKLHMTIGSYPASSFTLEQDLQLVKAAILYADSVKLYSPTYSMLWMVSELEDIPLQLKANFLEMITPYVSANRHEAKKLAAFLKSYNKRTRNARLTKQDYAFQKFIELNWIDIKEKTRHMIDGTGFEELNQLAQSELLDIHSFKQSGSTTSILEFIVDAIAQASGSPRLASRISEISARNDALISEFVEGVSNAVSSGDTYPLFDFGTGNLVRLGIKDGVIPVSEAGINRGKHSGLAGHLFERLPLFEQASLPEVLDIRRELDKYLVRYRQALIQFSTSIRSASWDNDFPLEAEDIFNREVAPAILDIEDAVKTNRYLISLLRKFTTNPLVLPSGAVLSVIMSQLSSLPNEVITGLGLASTATGAALVYSAYDEWRKERQEIEQNSLYFYYRAAKGLSKKVNS